jgi:hypothetical protein
MRSQYYDELIPAYEALQEELEVNSSSLFLICLRGIFSLGTVLLTLARHIHRLSAPSPETRGSEVAGMLSQPVQSASANT